jgi:hypothetical protein
VQEHIRCSPQWAASPYFPPFLRFSLFCAPASRSGQRLSSCFPRILLFLSSKRSIKSDVGLAPTCQMEGRRSPKKSWRSRSICSLPRGSSFPVSPTPNWCGRSRSEAFTLRNAKRRFLAHSLRRRIEEQMKELQAKNYRFIYIVSYHRVSSSARKLTKEIKVSDLGVDLYW